MQAIKNKIRSRRGASLTFALLLFLVCAVVGSVVLVAGTAASGRMSQIAEMDQRYYSVNSAARLLIDTIDGEEITDQAKTDGLHYELALEIAKRIETNDLSQITLSLSPETTPTGAKLDVSVVGTLSASGDLEYVVMNKVADGSTDNKQYKITLRFADTLGALGYKWKLYDIEIVMPQTKTEGSTP